MKTKLQILTEPIKIHAQFSREKSSDAESQMCSLWSLKNPPDILSNTKPLEAICAIIDQDIEEDYALELYEMSLSEAAESLYHYNQ